MLPTVFRKAKAAQEQQAVVQAGEQREAAAERVVPEEELEDGGLLVAAGPPVGVGHGELVEVGEQRGDPRAHGALQKPARVAARRCHVLAAEAALTEATRTRRRCLGPAVPRNPAPCWKHWKRTPNPHERPEAAGAGWLLTPHPSPPTEHTDPLTIKCFTINFLKNM